MNGVRSLRSAGRPADTSSRDHIDSLLPRGLSRLAARLLATSDSYFISSGQGSSSGSPTPQSSTKRVPRIPCPQLPLPLALGVDPDGPAVARCAGVAHRTGCSAMRRHRQRELEAAELGASGDLPVIRLPTRGVEGVAMHDLARSERDWLGRGKELVSDEAVGTWGLHDAQRIDCDAGRSMAL